MSALTLAATHIAPAGTAPRGARAPRRAATARASAGDRADPVSGPDVQVIADSSAKPGVPMSVSRRRALGVSAAAAAAAFLDASSRPALAEFQTSNEYMPSLEGKDYGKSKYVYPDFVQLPDGLQYKTMKEGTGAEMTSGKKAVIDWDGYTLGYYGRPFEARNKSKGGAFTGDDKEFVRFTADDPKIIPAFREAVLGMRAGEIRRVIVPGGSELSYPQGRKWKTMGPQPSNFSGERALGFVLENEGMIDKTLLFDIELIRVDDK
jgi:FKBP-type peptidyl-prolyl cis-trans isomerase